MVRGARTSSSTCKKRPRSPPWWNPSCSRWGRDRGPSRDDARGPGQGERGVRASSPEVRLEQYTRSSFSLLGRGVAASALLRLPLFTGVRGRGILRSSFLVFCLRLVGYG